MQAVKRKALEVWSDVKAHRVLYGYIGAFAMLALLSYWLL